MGEVVSITGAKTGREHVITPPAGQPWPAGLLRAIRDAASGSVATSGSDYEALERVARIAIRRMVEVAGEDDKIRAIGLLSHELARIRSSGRDAAE